MNKTKDELKKELAALKKRASKAEKLETGLKAAEQNIKIRLEFENTISTISSRFAGISNMDVAINRSLSDIGKLSGASRAYLFLIRKCGTIVDNTHEWCARGISPQIKNLKNLPCKMFPWWMKKLRSGKTIPIKDVSKMPLAAKTEKELLRSQDIKSLLVLPVHTRGTLSGFLGFDNVIKTGVWSEADFAVLRIVSEIIGNALERKQTEDEMKNKAEHLSALYELSKKTTSITSREELLPWIAVQAAKLLDADVCYYRLKEGNDLIRGGTTNKHMDMMVRDRIGIGEGLSGLIAKDKKPIIFQDGYADDLRHFHKHGERAKKHGFRSYLGVPMMIKNEVVGVINILSKKPGKFAEREAGLLTSFADMAAIAIHNAVLFEDLEQEIAERKEAEKKIKKSLNEKDLLLSEIHHRVKNNMQIISSLLILQSVHIKNSEVLDLLNVCQDRIKSMSLVHEMIYVTKEFGEIDFKEYIETLANNLLVSYSKDNNITLEIDNEDIFLDIDTAIPVGLIINELLTNSLKHAFKGREDGKISISLRSYDESKLKLIVKDNGVGIAEDFDIKNSKTLGLQIITLLAEKQLKGSIDFNRKNGGTEFHFILRKPKYKKRL